MRHKGVLRRGGEDVLTDGAPVDASRTIKAVIWDLDETLWPGILLEGTAGPPFEAVITTIQTLDERGIVQSLASRNPKDAALSRLRDCGLLQYFLCPQLHPGAKSHSVREISRRLDIAPAHIAFVDDQPFELDEVRHHLPEVLCIRAGDVPGILAMPRMNPPYLTPESRQRRALYAAELARQDEATNFPGPPEEFLRSLGLVAEIFRMESRDLIRAAELVARVHQLNTTGHALSFEELAAFSDSPVHTMWAMSLRDRCGSYGQVGLALVAHEPEVWTIKLLVVSCRVLSRGAADVLLWHVRAAARRRGAALQVEFIPNDTNALTSALLKLAGFREVARSGSLILLEDQAGVIEPPRCEVQYA